MRYLLFAIALSAVAFPLSAQNWTDINPQRLSGDRRIAPKEVRGLRVDPNQLNDLLRSAPHERQSSAEASTTRIRIPLPDGATTVFRIVGYDITNAAALARYPNIRTWYGVNVRNPRQTIFLDWTERGFHASVSGGGQPAYYLDPLFRDDLRHYQVYYRDDSGESGKNAFHCATLPDGFQPDTGETDVVGKQLGDCVLRQYQVAIATTHQYSNYHGALTADKAAMVQSAVVTSINRVNQIFTRDISLRLQLVGDNDKLYFYNELQNPYTANTVSALMGQNTSVIDARLGVRTYDMGHVYTQGANNGVARLRSTCGERRGAGATSHTAPENDPFNVDYVAHEMGHQLGGNHTQNNSCNYSASAGMEPGSASTIMGYAGICSPNVQGRSDDYFHGRSIEEITNWLENNLGGSCANVISSTLTNPKVAATTDYLIPPGTPLKLSGSANGDANLTYNWEQYDVAQASMPPKEDSEAGPLFRSFPAAADSSRYLPRLTDVIRGNDPMWEELPMVARDLNFRLTVLNANATYGCAGEADLNLRVDTTEGPFLVTDPNDGNQWSRGQIAQVQWQVAGTDDTTFRSPTVDILLTTNEGISFDTLARSVPNNGLAEVQVPNEKADEARILVRSVDNVFYNISSKDFSIVDSVGIPAVTVEPLTAPGMAGCFIDVDSVSFHFLTASQQGASSALQLSVTSLPEGVSAHFSPASVRPGGRFRLLLSGFSLQSQGQYDAMVIGTSPDGNFSQEITVTKLGDSDSAGPTPLYPTDEAEDTRPLLEAEDTQADNFEIQLSDRVDFSNLLYHVLRPQPNFTPPIPLAPSTRYYWRIRGKSDQGGCSASKWAAASFVTGTCFAYQGEIDSVVISDGLPPQISEIPINVPQSGIVRDVDVLRLDVTHSFLKDLFIELEHPDGRSIPLFERNCSSNDNLFFSLDDEAVTSTYTCPPVGESLFVRPPSRSLDRFDDTDSQGQWILRVTDNANQDGGMLNSVGLKLCIEGDFSLPVSFLSFTATGRKEDILLRWATEEESNNLGFYVERTEDVNAGTWRELGFVAAETDYHFADATAQPATDYYYRLRQTDLDGSVRYSGIRTARLGTEAANGTWLLYPNPTSNRINYRWLGEATNAPRTFQLFDARGRLVHAGQLTINGGSVDLRPYPGGIYLLRSGGEVFRLVKR